MKGADPSVPAKPNYLQKPAPVKSGFKPFAGSYKPVSYAAPVAAKPTVSTNAAPSASPAPPPPATFVNPPPPVMTAPVYTSMLPPPPPPLPPTSSQAPPPPQNFRKNQYSLGIEGFYDEYREHIVELKEHAKFGSLTGSATHYFNPNLYGTIEARASRGSNDYKSQSGVIKDIDQWEFENRLLAGYDQVTASGRHYLFYLGLGTRYFLDESKGGVTERGLRAYDRRILQFYMPIGLTYKIPAYGLMFTPNIEVDPLLYGRVNSRLQNLGYYEINNDQHDGFGMRGELMVGKLNSEGMGWQAGPFIRYWHVKDSDFYQTPDRLQWVEPENNRFQFGATVRYLF